MKKEKIPFSAKRVLSGLHDRNRCVEIDESLRRELQRVLLSMYLDIKEVCERNGISLFLCGGSALGAVRHRGFIPWDDDLDVSMTRSDYDRFQELFYRELGDKYYLKAPGYKEGSRIRFPKVMKKNTVFRELGNLAPDEECGVFVDIFIIDNVPDNMLLRNMKGAVCNGLEFISGQVRVQNERSDLLMNEIKKADKKQYFIRKAAGVLFSFRSVNAWNRTLDRWIQYNKESRYCALATGRKHYFGEILPRAVFLPGKKGLFEGHDVLLYADVDAYLKNLYGDYWQIPPESERERHVVEDIRL